MGDAGAFAGIFDLKQMTGVGHHLVAVAELGVHLAIDLVWREGVVLVGVGADEYDWALQFIEAGAEVETLRGQIDTRFAFARAAQYPLARCVVPAQDRTRHQFMSTIDRSPQAV